MLNRIRRTIETHSMLNRGDHLVVAVSGGPDSVALLHILMGLREEYQLRLTAAHLNHGLRKDEADREEFFVHRLCADMGIACVCRRTNIIELKKGKSRSLEEIGREERYRFFQETALQCGAGKIAVGHHRDDQAETLLLHLLRGSGMEGLRGILPVRDGRIIRPLLDVGRSEILEYLRLSKISYVTDSSNRSTLFLRNRIRNELIPETASRYNPRLVETLCRTAEIIRRDNDYLSEVVRQILNGWQIVPGSPDIALPVADFQSLHEAIQGRIVKCLLESAASNQKDISYRHVESVLSLARRTDCRYLFLDMPFGVIVERGRDVLRIRKNRKQRVVGRSPEKKRGIQFEYRVNVPATVHLKEIGRIVRLDWSEKPTLEEMSDRPETAFMDYDRFTLPLTLRNFRPGDRIHPLGSDGTKKLKEYFIDRKIPAPRRSEIPLLVDAVSIVWIGGERISERVRVTERTRRVLKAEVLSSSNFHADSSAQSREKAFEINESIL